MVGRGSRRRMRCHNYVIHCSIVLPQLLYNGEKLLLLIAPNHTHDHHKNMRWTKEMTTTRSHSYLTTTYIPPCSLTLPTALSLAWSWKQGSGHTSPDDGQRNAHHLQMTFVVQCSDCQEIFWAVCDITGINSSDILSRWWPPTNHITVVITEWLKLRVVWFTWCF